jgi:hypothetical protein
MLAASTSAAPPKHGLRAPQPVASKQIDDDYVGAVYVGPIGSCANGCTKVRLVRCRAWRRSNGDWAHAGTLSNERIEVGYAAPLGGGYHWLWLGRLHGFRAIASSCLYEFAPVS